MKIQSLTVVNFRAITRLELRNLPWSVVIAGPNGCGKSCVFDAVRLLKSIYGGYSADEHMQWFNELGIVVQDPTALRKMFRDPSKPLHVAAALQFTESERRYMLREADRL